MHIYTVLWDCKYTGHQSQGICRCPWLAIAKTWGSRGVRKLSSDRYQQSEARQREGGQVARTACLPEIHSVSHQMCTKPEACPSGRSTRMPKRPPSQKHWWGAGALSAVCAVACRGVGEWGTCRETSLMATVPWDQEMQAPQPLKLGDQRASHGCSHKNWGTICKNQGLRYR